jgi:hypothetical protein
MAWHTTHTGFVHNYGDTLLRRTLHIPPSPAMALSSLPATWHCIHIDKHKQEGLQMSTDDAPG